MNQNAYNQTFKSAYATAHLELEDAALMLVALLMPPKQLHQRRAVAVAQPCQLAVHPAAQALHMSCNCLRSSKSTTASDRLS